jgi:hypothetical protein
LIDPRTVQPLRSAIPYFQTSFAVPTLARPAQGWAPGCHRFRF